MRRRTGAALGAVVVLALALYAGGVGAGPLPPLGYLLDPVRGAWGSLAFLALPDSARGSIPSLSAPVEIRYDVRHVPHIFAQTEADAIRALGFVVARDRLFQMELQARAGAGTLTELVGAVAVQADSGPRGLGMARGAERMLAALDTSSEEAMLLQAYSEGVNAYIEAAPRAEWPVEYKLLGTRPARWNAVNSFYLYARMGWTLAHTSAESEQVAARALVGAAATAAILPRNSPIQEPIQPNGRGAARVDFARIPAPGAADSEAVALLPLLPGDPASTADVEVSRRFASNNWAVAPSRSKSGRAMLAGDPHLELTLPSIWYEAHLVVPGRLDVYGVTIPGAPGIVIGFNRNVAWSLTNTGADVLDYYRETVDEQLHPTKYLLDDEWRPLERRQEVYRGKRGQVIRIDTVSYTHRGPLMRMGTDWVSMRWTVNETSREAGAFFSAARATTAQEFLDIFARDFFAPAQNVIVADRQGNIGIRSTGHYPIRPDDGDGLTIRDGSRRASDWLGYWPVSRYPQALNPPQGFLASANQQPIDPAVDSGYFGYESSFEVWRALQINRLLRANAAVTLDDMRRYQTDPGSVRADAFYPYFRRAAAVASARGLATPALTSADSVLARWDRRYTVENTGAVLFEAAMQQLTRETWDELIPPGERSRVATPTTTVLLQLLSDSTNAWWDDRRTPGSLEDRDVILARALAAAYGEVIRRAGDPSTDGWQWGKVAPAQVHHLLGLSGFSELNVPVQGGRGTLNPSAQNGAYGSSWRMVVELGDRVRAMGTYPGGQSGNPASPRYLDRLKVWRQGDLELLIVPSAPDSLAPSQVSASLSLSPGRK
ncbi:MAG: penicillin acylase family protein [Gemmatimonadaceae bacterium]